MHHIVPIAILEKLAPATVTLLEVEISGSGVVVAAKEQEMALGKCVQ